MSKAVMTRNDTWPRLSQRRWPRRLRCCCGCQLEPKMRRPASTAISRAGHVRRPKQKTPSSSSSRMPEATMPSSRT